MSLGICANLKYGKLFKREATPNLALSQKLKAQRIRERRNKQEKKEERTEIMNKTMTKRIQLLNTTIF